MYYKNITKPEIATLLRIGKTTVDNYIAELKKDGRIKRTGSNKTGYWEGVKNAAVITHGCNPELVKGADLLRNPDTNVKQFKKCNSVIVELIGKMDKFLYEDIFKRKSFHLFRNVENDIIENNELEKIKNDFSKFDSLYPEIKTAIRILPASEVNFKRDAEYCILIYSEKKDNYLMNVGYIGQQLDLYLVHHNIGSLWFGIGKPDKETYEGLNYVIMIAIHKVNNQSMYRKDMFKAKRKALEEIWSGETLGIADVVRFAPSACNSQPWFVKNENGTLTVSRYKKPGKRGIMPAKAVSYFNRIDIGIFLCILELCMQKQKIAFERALFVDDGSDREYTKSAEYRIK